MLRGLFRVFTRKHWMADYFYVRPWSVDSVHGGSGDVMKIPPIEKKSRSPFFFIFV